ncbi:MAG: hypothetical protein ACXWQ5_13730 [Ktedonobacterales bacterium]
MDTLVVHETRRAALEILRRVFAQETGIEIVSHGTVAEFDRDLNLDAIVLSPPVAYELYGGKGPSNVYHEDTHLGRPVFVSDAEIIDSHQAPLKQAQTPVPWIVTYGGFKARIDFEPGEDDETANLIVVPEDALTPAEMFYLEYMSMLEKIAEANAAGLTPQIRRLGVSTRGLFPTLRDDEMTLIATTVRAAYREYRQTCLQR